MCASSGDGQDMVTPTWSLLLHSLPFFKVFYLFSSFETNLIFPQHNGHMSAFSKTASFVLYYKWSLQTLRCHLCSYLSGYWVDNMDLSFWWSWFESLRRDERCFVIPFTEQRAGRLLRMLTYSVSRYLCNGIRGFHRHDEDVSVELCIILLWCPSSLLFFSISSGRL